MRLDFSQALRLGSSEVSRVYLGSNLTYTNAVITHLGRENETTGGLFAVSNWSDTSVLKKFNTGAAEKYGTSGYYQIRPGATTNITDAVGAGNDLGISAGTNPTLYSAPSFATITGSAGTLVSFGGYPSFDNPTATASLRQGSLSVSVNQGPFTTPAGSNTGYFGELATITLTEDADFILGVATNTVATGQYAPNYVSVYSSAGGIGTVFSSSISRADSTPRMPFFLIKGTSGNVFNVALWQLASDPTHGAPSVAAAGLITFDRIN